MSPCTATGQFQVRLMPQHQGAFTQVTVAGSVPTAIPRRQLRPMMRGITFWSGWPVALALPAEVEAVEWFELWADALPGISADHLQIRLEVMTEAPIDD